MDHFADNYNEVIELAEKEPEKSVMDSDALQYFAVDVYAYDIAAPGVGCSGASQAAHSHEQSSTASVGYTAVASTTSVRSAAVSTTMQTMASLTTSAAAVS